MVISRLICVVVNELKEVWCEIAGGSAVVVIFLIMIIEFYLLWVSRKKESS